MMAGLTGYGIGSALQGAGAAAGAADATTAATQTATDAATKAAMTDPNLITSAASNVGPVAPTLNPQGILEVQKRCSSCTTRNSTSRSNSSNRLYRSSNRPNNWFIFKNWYRCCKRCFYR